MEYKIIAVTLDRAVPAACSEPVTINKASFNVPGEISGFLNNSYRQILDSDDTAVNKLYLLLEKINDKANVVSQYIALSVEATQLEQQLSQLIQLAKALTDNEQRITHRQYFLAIKAAYEEAYQLLLTLNTNNSPEKSNERAIRLQNNITEQESSSYYKKGTLLNGLSWAASLTGVTPLYRAAAPQMVQDQLAVLAATLDSEAKALCQQLLTETIAELEESKKHKEIELNDLLQIYVDGDKEFARVFTEQPIAVWEQLSQRTVAIATHELMIDPKTTAMEPSAKISVVPYSKLWTAAGTKKFTEVGKQQKQ